MHLRGVHDKHKKKVISSCLQKEDMQKVTRVGFEPTPMKTTALTLRLRPLGHRVVLLPLLDTINKYKHVVKISR